MYVCRWSHHTVIPHIGNARPFVTWDVIRRHNETCRRIIEVAHENVGKHDRIRKSR